MSTIITIPTDLAKKIAGRAAAEGKNVRQFALESLEKAAISPSLRELFVDDRKQIRVSCISEEELDARIESSVDEVRKQRRRS